MIQAVSNRGELCFRVFEGSFTQAVYRDFLKRLLKQAGGRKLYLVQNTYEGVDPSEPPQAW